MMLDANAIAELEKRLQQMDAQPRSLDLLKQALETVAATLSVQVKIRTGNSSLLVESDGADWVIKLEDNDYHYTGMKQANSWDRRGQSTSKLTWSIMGATQHFRVRAVVAAAAQGKK